MSKLPTRKFVLVSGAPSVLLLLCLTACTANQYRKAADREAYRAIAQKTPLVKNMDKSFTLEPGMALSFNNYPEVTVTNEFMGASSGNELGARRLNLQQSLDIAVRYSRQFLDAKDQLYLAALSLTLARHEFAPIFSGHGDGSYIVQTENFVETEPDPQTGEPRPVLSDNLVESHSVRADGSLGVDWLIRDVGRISAAFTTDFLRIITGDPRVLASSALSATFTRPLLRNAGFKSDVENLTQAERDLLYELRDFTRFRKTFTVQVASSYYGVLGNRDAVRNSFLNLQGSRRAGDRTRALAREGRTTQSDLGRIEQQELSAESAWVNANRSYERSLDDFKILLGIPVEAKIVLDDAELEQLAIHHPDIRPEEAVKVALSARLDYQNALDQVADSERKVKLAADRLRPQVDFVANAGLVSAETDRFAVPDPNRYHYNAGLSLDLPLERKVERNAYRQSLITRERLNRSRDLQRDQIEQQVRDSWRSLEQAKRNFELSVIGVDLSQRRVEEQELLAELGRARALDQVDAQNALVSSKDQRTQALVQHTVARLQFWSNMGILYIKPNGSWEPLKEPASSSLEDTD